MSEIVEAVAKAIGETLYGSCDRETTPNTWALAESAARAAIDAALAAERERCAGIAKEIAYGNGTDFGSVNAILYGWPTIGECQHGKMESQECAECPKAAREKWWLKEPME